VTVAFGAWARIGVAADHDDAANRRCIDRQRGRACARGDRVLEQHHRLLGGLECGCIAGRGVDRAAGLGGRIHDADAIERAQLALDHVVEPRLRHRARRHRGLELLVEVGRHAVETEGVVGRAGFLLVETGVGAAHRVGERGEPVGLHLALEAPFGLEHVGQQRLVLARLLAVDEVVRAHHVAGLAFLDADLERQQMQLAQRAFVDHRVRDEAVRLLVVGGEVLDRRDDLLILRAAGARRDEQAGEHRVFAHVFEGAAVAQFAREIHAAAEAFGEADRAQLFRDVRTVVVGELFVPARGERDGRRHRRRVVFDDAAVHRLIHAGGRIGDVVVGNAESRNAGDIAGAAERAGLRADAVDHLDLLVLRHLREQGGGLLVGHRVRIARGGCCGIVVAAACEYACKGGAHQKRQGLDLHLSTLLVPSSRRAPVAGV